jgi:hypothetical protein
MEAQEVFLTKTRDTKNTFRYDEEGDEADFVLRSLYLNKKVGTGPARIKVTIEEA